MCSLSDEGGSLDTKRLCPDAEKVIFSTGFDKPTYLSINTSNELEVASSAVTETTTRSRETHRYQPHRFPRLFILSRDPTSRQPNRARY